MSKTAIPAALLEKFAEEIKADYVSWWMRSNTGTGNLGAGPEHLTETQKKMVQEFNDSIRFDVGSTYIKVVAGSSVHSFIVTKVGRKGFAVGTILKAASWKAPATNFARGNILTGYKSNCTRWTGAQ
jgi:hypothetical protein